MNELLDIRAQSLTLPLALDGIPIDVEALDNLRAFANHTCGASLVGADDPATPLTASQTNPAAGTDANSGWPGNGDNESCTEEPDHPRTMSPDALHMDPYVPPATAEVGWPRNLVVAAFTIPKNATSRFVGLLSKRRNTSTLEQ